MSVKSSVIAYLRGKGLNDYAIAGFLGNMKIESGFNTSALNGAEGAIGLIQWEGGRRSALQSYARKHGTSETDLRTQLDFMWHELSGGYSHVLNQLKHVGSAGDAAAIIDAQYEISSGNARGQRVSAARQYMQGGLKGGTVPGGGGGGTGGKPHTADDYSGVDSLGSLLDSVPELRKLVDKAVKGDWSMEKFQNSIEDSKWWKSHSATARSVITQRANDPASYSRSIQNVKNTLNSMTSRLGMKLSASQLAGIANTALLTGNDSNQDWLTHQISAKNDYTHLKSLGSLTGQMASTAQQLRELAYSYGHRWDPSLTARYAQNVLDGTGTVEQYKQRLERWAVSAFPGLGDQIRGGATLKELGDPYVQSMAQVLEMNPESLSVFTPQIRKALMGASAKPGEVPSTTPLWQFENQLRTDPRWQYTDNAHASMASMAIQLGNAWGFNG